MEQLADQWSVVFDGVRVMATRVADGYSVMLLDGDIQVAHPTPESNLELARNLAVGLLYHHLRNEKRHADPNLTEVLDGLQWRPQ